MAQQQEKTLMQNIRTLWSKPKPGTLNTFLVVDVLQS